jgi:hypothetical protein
MKDCQGKERRDGQRLGLPLRETRISEVQRRRAAPRKTKKRTKWWRRKREAEAKVKCTWVCELA